jgi:hypothetical protein
VRQATGGHGGLCGWALAGSVMGEERGRGEILRWMESQRGFTECCSMLQ